MRPLRNSNRGKICVSLMESTGAGMVRAVREANRLADLIEIRMDHIPQARVEPILSAAERPIVVAIRHQRHGGRFAGPEKNRLKILQEAIAGGAAFIDLEAQSRGSFLREVQARKTRTRTVLSYHDFRRTPPQSTLREICRRMAEEGADVVKIVTMAASASDNLRTLALIPFARERNQEIVAFCMGPKGTWSRVFGPLIGAAWTYACLSDRKKSAPGQLTAKKIREIWKRVE